MGNVVPILQGRENRGRTELVTAGGGAGAEDNTSETHCVLGPVPLVIPQQSSEEGCGPCGLGGEAGRRGYQARGGNGHL